MGDRWHERLTHPHSATGKCRVNSSTQCNRWTQGQLIHTVHYEWRMTCMIKSSTQCTNEWRMTYRVNSSTQCSNGWRMTCRVNSYTQCTNGWRVTCRSNSSTRCTNGRRMVRSYHYKKRHNHKTIKNICLRQHQITTGLILYFNNSIYLLNFILDIMILHKYKLYFRFSNLHFKIVRNWQVKYRREIEALYSQYLTPKSFHCPGWKPI